MAVKMVNKAEAIEAPTRAEPTLPAPRIRPPQKDGVAERFSPSDTRLDLTKLPIIGPRLEQALRSRRFQFSLILPSQILFWLVVFAGFFGTVEATENFGTTITWFVWFALIFPLTLVVGRAWCVTCPFGGFGEWIQRRTFWKRTQKALGLDWKMPESLAGYGLVISAVLFIGMTWLEEFFNIAGPGLPILTSFMVLGIIGSSTLVFLLFERRTFCRYFCPLSSLIGYGGFHRYDCRFQAEEQRDVP